MVSAMDGSWMFSGNVRKRRSVELEIGQGTWPAGGIQAVKLVSREYSRLSPLLLFLVNFSRCYVPVVRLGVGLGGVFTCACSSWMASLKATSPHARLVGSSCFFFLFSLFQKASSGCFVIASAGAEPTERFWLLLAARMGSGSCCLHYQGVSPCEPV